LGENLPWRCLGQATRVKTSLRCPGCFEETKKMNFRSHYRFSRGLQEATEGAKGALKPIWHLSYLPTPFSIILGMFFTSLCFFYKNCVFYRRLCVFYRRLL